MTKTKRMQVRLTERDWRMLHAEAKKRRMGVGVLVRSLAVACVEGVRASAPEAGRPDKAA